MNFIKKIWKWEKAQFKKPETHLVLGMVGGLLIGVGTDNIGLGVALGLVLGIAGYSTIKQKQKKNNEKESTAESTNTNKEAQG